MVGSNPQLVDGVTVFEPFLQYTRSQLPHIPLWDPYIMGGTPYLADMQSAIFSPFSLPAYVLPFWWSLRVIAVMKVVVAATGTYLLARALKMGQAGAFMAGLVFGFGLFLIAWIPWPLDNVFPLIPWMLYATERLVRRPGVLSASGLAALVALQFFGGHPESSVYALFAVVGYFVLRLLQGAGGGVAGHGGRGAPAGGPRGWRPWPAASPRPVVAFVCALVVGTALAAVVLLPFLELLHNSSDLTARPRSQVHVQAKYVFAAFLPRYFPGSFEIETAFYAGALPLMLAFAALLRPRVERVAVAVVGAASLLVVLGIQPLFALAGRTPGLDQTYLSRLTIIYLLCLALLAGWGLDDLVRRRPSRRVAVSIGAVAVVLALLPLVVVAGTRATSCATSTRPSTSPGSSPPPPSRTPRTWSRSSAWRRWWCGSRWPASPPPSCCLRLTRVLPARAFALLAMALVVGDLFQAGMGYNPAIPQSNATQPVTGAISYLQHQGTARYVGVTPYNTTVPLPPDVNIRYGLTDLRGYDLPVISRVRRPLDALRGAGHAAAPRGHPVGAAHRLQHPGPFHHAGPLPLRRARPPGAEARAAPQHPRAHRGLRRSRRHHLRQSRGAAADLAGRRPGGAGEPPSTAGADRRPGLPPAPGGGDRHARCPGWPRRPRRPRRGRPASPPTAPSGWPSPPTPPARASWCSPTPGTRGGR